MKDGRRPRGARIQGRSVTWRKGVEAAGGGSGSEGRRKRAAREIGRSGCCRRTGGDAGEEEVVVDMQQGIKRETSAERANPAGGGARAEQHRPVRR